MIVLDNWQKEFIYCDENKVLVSGRQTGKSEAAAYDASQYAEKNPRKNVLIISRTERQAQELLLKTLYFLDNMNKKAIKKGKTYLTKSKIELTNGSKIISLPTGSSGEGIRGYTIHKLIVDEAQLVDDPIFTSVTPMLLTTGGKITLLGTPQGKKGFFWRAYENKLGQFKVFHINSEQVIRDREINADWPEWRRQAALDHFAAERMRMSEKEYAQEYLGEFIEDLNQFFPDEVIKKACILKRPDIFPLNDNYLGCDIARMGGDEITFEILNATEGKKIKQIDSIVKRYRYTTETEDDIRKLIIAYNVQKFGIDAGSGALGVGIFDRFMEDPKTKRKVVALNNRAVSLERDGSSRQRIMKEDFYDNLLSMMEKGEILLLDDDEVQASLKSVQIEINTKSKVSRYRIFGSYTHIAEGLTRAAWLAKKEKIIKLKIRYI